MKVPFSMPNCGSEELEDVAEVIRSGWLTTGPRVSYFEKEFSKYIGAKFCLAVNSCTAALHLGLEALGVKSGDKVIVPVHTFTATAEVVRYLHADPIFADVDQKTICLAPEGIQKAINEWKPEHGGKESIKAVIPVHFGGHPCDMESILKLAQIYDLKVMEDAAHALPCFCRFPQRRGETSETNPVLVKKRMIGALSNVTCFSFYANKTITTAEGGMIATDDENIAERAKVMRLHGINRDVWNRFSDVDSGWEYDVIASGFKYNMPDLAAALGVNQLKKASQFHRRRQEIAKIYYDELSDISGLILPQIDCSIEDHSWHLYVVLVEPEGTRNWITRDKLISELKKRSVGTSVHYIPLHRMTYYKKRYKLKPEMFPNSERIFRRCLSLPIYSAMTNEQIEYVVNSIKNIMNY